MAQGTNYITNPSFSVNATGWTATGGTQALDTTHAQPGAGQNCLALSPTTAVCYTTYSCAGLTIGKRYTASAYYEVPVASACSILIQAGATAGWDSRGQTGRWGRVSVSFTALTTTVAVLVGTVGGVTGQPFYIDKVLLTDGDGVGPYFDGDYPQCSWTGTAGASTSTCAPLVLFTPTTEEMVLAGGLALQTVAWNISTKTGRYAISAQRGDNTKVPGATGATFVKHKPADTGLYTLSMWVLGTLANGTIPFIGEGRRVFEQNLAQLLQSIRKTFEPVTLSAWQPDGTVRQTTGDLNAATDPTLYAGGQIGQFNAVFEILPGVWQDWFAIATVGSAGAGWSNQNLLMPGLIGGTAVIEDAVVTVHGPAVNPVVSNPNTGVSIQLNATLGTTDVWVIDSGAFTSTLNGTSNIGSITHSGHQRFVVIPPGELMAAPILNLTATGTGTNTNLSVTARRKHWTA